MKLLCGQCGKTFDAPDGSASPIACPHCGHQVMIPHDDSALLPTEETASQGEEGFATLAMQEVARRYHFQCGACGKHLSVARRRFGEHIRCPACGRRIRVPDLSDQDDAQLQRWSSRKPKREAIDASEPGESGNEQTDVIIETQPFDELVDELQQARPPQKFRKPSLPIGAIIAVAGAVTGGLLLWLLVQQWILRSQEDRPDGPDQRAEPNRQPIDTAQQQEAEPRQEPTPRQEPNIGAVPSEPQPESQVLREVVVESIVPAMFAAAGYFPAAPESLYWKISLRFSCGRQASPVSTAGASVVLRCGDRSVPSLGIVAPPGDVLPVRCTTDDVTIPAGGDRTLVLLFEMPAGMTPDSLWVRDVGQVRLSQPARLPTAGELDGTYTEAPPRNLQPQLADPVMAASQGVAAQQLVTTASAEGLRVTLPQAGVRGTAEPRGGGLYDVRLHYGEHTLNGALRVFDQGRGVVLYLSPAPFHQITFTRR